MESSSISSKLEKNQIKKSAAYLQKLFHSISHIQSNQLLQRTNRSLKVFIYLLQKPIAQSFSRCINNVT